ncbi:MAG TPA: alkaline phosphatase [Saprospiraceae bacterium]|nr:alkaline phosphatase [Saprospiraceae bacterium]
MYKIAASILGLFLLFQCRPTQTISQNTGRKTSDAASPVEPISQAKPLNIVLMIGDGMGLTQMSAGMYMNDNKLELERCTAIGLHKSYSANDLITDSAAGANAFSTGKKTKNGYLGVDSNGIALPTILEYASHRGMATGMVVTSTLVHATPAAFMAHQSGREDYESIAKDYMRTPCNLLVGGGKKYFDRRISDSLNLVDQMRSNGYTVSDYFEEEYETISLPKVQKYCFFTADGDPLPAARGRNYLPKASKDACEFLGKTSTKGFFLMIEGSQIDWGGHANQTDYIVTEVLDFNKAIGNVLDFAKRNENTLVIITADHETGGFAINTGSTQGNIIGAFTTPKHTGSLIPVYAYGPGSSDFIGIYENTEIYYKMMKLLGRYKMTEDQK